MNKVCAGYKIDSPLGDIVVRTENDFLTGLFFAGQKYFPMLAMAEVVTSASAPRATSGASPATTSNVSLEANLEACSDAASDTPIAAEPYIVRQARDELAAFFTGALRVFTTPYRVIGGTRFQQQVWQELARIPYGESVSYGYIARRLNLPVGTARAIGSANGRNPLSIIVPCHRVIAASGALTGYAGGVDRKDALLRLEARQMGQKTVPSEQFCLTL